MEKLTYPKRLGDKAYRVIPLDAVEITEEESPFTSDHVYYSANCVLEIIKNTNERLIVYNGSISGFRCERRNNEILIAAEIPLQRLWIRKKKCPLVRYKVPVNLPLDDSGKWHRLYLPNIKKWTEMEFCADPYFEKVYPFKRGEA